VADFVSGNTSKLSNNDGGMLRDVAAAAATTTLSLLLLLLLLTPLFDPPASSSSAVDFMWIRLSRSESITSLCRVSPLSSTLANASLQSWDTYTSGHGLCTTPLGTTWHENYNEIRH
jgi:hypothetical protein